MLNCDISVVPECQLPASTFLNLDCDMNWQHQSDLSPFCHPLGRPTQVSYLKAQTRLAEFMDRFRQQGPWPQYSTVLSFDADLQSLLHDMPFLSRHSADYNDLYPWLPAGAPSSPLSFVLKANMLKLQGQLDMSWH